MKAILMDGEAKEIAGLVLALQGQQKQVSDQAITEIKNRIIQDLEAGFSSSHIP